MACHCTTTPVNDNARIVPKTSGDNRKILTRSNNKRFMFQSGSQLASGRKIIIRLSVGNHRVRRIMILDRTLRIHKPCPGGLYAATAHAPTRIGIGTHA